ncbi:MAG TPA: hypothetical protein VL294_08390 [Pseudolysinimonas sp.]|nr:hypothetical protein [Pseudolysinimonas sp.]
MRHPFVRRFRRRAAIVVTAGLAVVVALIVVGAVLLRSDAGIGLMLWVFAAAMVAGAVVLVVHARPRILALRRVVEHNPDGAVLLARRQPALVSDLATYLGESDVYDAVSDRWVVASIDDRGLAAWSVGREPRELVLMPWGELGTIELTRLESGGPGVAVDVKPFAEPLVVAAGYAAFGVLSSFTRRGVDEVVATVNALRPS